MPFLSRCRKRSCWHGKNDPAAGTHIFLWWLFDDSRLPAGIRRAVEDADNAVLISAASVWEITTKFRLGKLPEAAAVAKNVPLWIEKAGFAPLAVSPAHAQLAGAWKQAHDALAAFPIQIMSR